MPVAMFIGTFSWSFVYVSLPFHIPHISPRDPASTLRWTGWILGVFFLPAVGHASLPLAVWQDPATARGA